MPKERIYAKHDPTYVEAETPDSDIRLAGVEVQWNQHEPLSSNEAAVRIGTGHLNHHDDAYDANSGIGPISVPYYIEMNRDELNKFIRVLKRACRVMYGGDE